MTARLALVLAVDVSASVDFDEFALMIGGLAGAFRDAAVQEAARGAACCALFWSEAQELAVPWAALDDAAACEDFAAALEMAPRRPRAGATALGEAMAAALALLARGPEARRHVLDVSGDGRSNRGRAPAPLRDLGVAAGVVINALAVENEEPELRAYYEAEVIGGRGAFAMACPDYEAFREAMARKLLRELEETGLVASLPP